MPIKSTFLTSAAAMPGYVLLPLFSAHAVPDPATSDLVSLRVNGQLHGASGILQEDVS